MRYGEIESYPILEGSQKEPGINKWENETSGDGDGHLHDLDLRHSISNCAMFIYVGQRSEIQNRKLYRRQNVATSFGVPAALDETT